MSIAKLARPEIQALNGYQAAAQLDDTIRLNANESPRESPIGDFRRPLNRYPEVRPQRLQSALAERFGCRHEQLLVTRGSSEGIDLVIRTFCRAGRDSIVSPSPSFSMYGHYAEVQGAAMIEVAAPAANDFRIDIDSVLDACDESTRVVFVCSPNNPTGTSIPRRDLLRLIEGRVDQSAVVVDEAYIDFSGEPSIIEVLSSHPNLVVLRTLSKALGFAGARCGAVMAAADVIRLLDAVQAPYALATPVVECVEDVLQSDQLALAEDSLREIVAERERVRVAIARYHFVRNVWPSDANFFLIQVTDPESVMQCCRARNVLLRHLGGTLSNCLRITVGSQTDNDRLLQALDTLVDV